jgi:hypothetical protein
MNVLTKLPKLLAAIVLLWPAVAGGADQSVWPLTAYQVRVFVALAPEAPLTPRLEASLLADLAARIEAVVGPPWNVIVEAPPPALRRDMLHGLDTLQADKIPMPTPEPDKILFVTVTVVPGGLKVTARDFDAHAHILSCPVTRQVWQIGSLCDASMDALLTAFAPLARIERIDHEGKDGIAILRVKAAGLPVRDPNLKILQPGDVFRPLVRYNNRNSKFQSVIQAKWSLCVVEKITPEEVRSRVYTGMRSEMPTKGRGRNESLALRVRSPGGSTQVVFQSRVAPNKPLAGCDVYAYPPDKRDQKEAVVLIGQTDRRGALIVPPLPGTLLRVLVVKNGTALLGKLPIVPGLEPQLTAPIPNDDQRLGAEGFITGLQEELLDLVARQKILIATIKLRAEAKQFDKAAELLDTLRRLDTAQKFHMRLVAEQEALATNDPSMQKKIDLLMNDTKQLIDKWLDPQVIDDLDRDLRELKTTAEKNAAN